MLSLVWQDYFGVTPDLTTMGKVCIECAITDAFMSLRRLAKPEH